MSLGGLTHDPDKFLHVEPGDGAKARGQIKGRLVVPVFNFGKVRLRCANDIGDFLKGFRPVRSAPMIKRVGFFRSGHSLL